MRNLIRTTFWFWVGYSAVTQAAPYVQARLETLGLDQAWEALNDNEEVE